jgi:hypothetical protein
MEGWNLFEGGSYVCAGCKYKEYEASWRDDEGVILRDNLENLLGGF